MCSALAEARFLPRVGITMQSSFASVAEKQKSGRDEEPSKHCPYIKPSIHTLIFKFYIYYLLLALLPMSSLKDSYKSKPKRFTEMIRSGHNPEQICCKNLVIRKMKLNLTQEETNMNTCEENQSRRCY